MKNTVNVNDIDFEDVIKWCVGPKHNKFYSCVGRYTRLKMGNDAPNNDVKALVRQIEAVLEEMGYIFFCSSGDDEPLLSASGFVFK